MILEVGVMLAGVVFKNTTSQTGVILPNIGLQMLC